MVNAGVGTELVSISDVTVSLVLEYDQPSQNSNASLFEYEFVKVTPRLTKLPSRQSRSSIVPRRVRCTTYLGVRSSKSTTPAIA